MRCSLPCYYCLRIIPQWYG